MHYFYVRISNFYLKGAEGAVVLHDGQVVLDTSIQARDQAVQPGCTLREAKAILGAARYIRHDEASFSHRQRRWLDVCAKYSDAIEPDQQHSAWVDMAAHARTLDLAALLHHDLTELDGNDVHIGIADNKWVAALACREDVPIRAVEDTYAFLSPLPIAQLIAIPHEQRERLRALGYRTIGQARKATMRALRSQFADEGMRIYHAVRGVPLDHVRACYPEASISARRQLDATCDLEYVQTVLRDVSEELAEKLCNADHAAQEVRLYVTFEDQSVQCANRKSSKPFQSVGNLFLILDLLMGKLNIAMSLTHIRVVLPELKSAKRLQSAFEAMRGSEERTRSAEDSFRAIRYARGEMCVTRASAIEEPRRKKLLRAWRTGFEF